MSFLAKNLLVFFTFIFLLQPMKTWAVNEPVILTTEEDFSAPRWMFGTGELPKGNSVEALLAGVKKAQLDEDAETCLRKSEMVWSKAKSLQAWISSTELDCATKLKPSLTNANSIAKVLERVDLNPAWLLKGPQAETLRARYIESMLLLAEWDLKFNRSRGWKTIDRLREMSSWMNERQKARQWRTAGELAFLQQKPDAAKDFFRRSLAEVDSQELRMRLKTMDAPSMGPAPTPASLSQNQVENSSRPMGNALVESTQEELELVERVTTALKSGDLVPAVTDAVKIIKNYPGSQRAKWAADRAFEAYWSFADKTDANFQLLKKQILNQMLQADADRLAEWARVMYNRAQFADSHELAKKALKEISGTRSTALLDLAAKAAVASDDFESARKLFNQLTSQHAGTQAAREGFMRSGLLHYRQGAYSQAVSDFEKVNSFPDSESLQVISRYWMWRSLQKMKSDKADQAADELLRIFPFSYYGLRARLERSGNVLDWKSERKKAESKIWLTGPERLSYEKARLLVKAGWLDEAQAELRELPGPARAEDKAVRALLWAAAGAHNTASRLVNEAWDEKSELRAAPFVDIAFPREFETVIATNANQRRIDRYLIQGLIKQESGYFPRATSVSNAMGLMQIIPSTARELASDLKITPFDPTKDLYKPNQNIQMGTFYISRLVNKYQGSVPVGLAAYNAGQGRIDRWLRMRPSLKDIAKKKSSHHDDEIWIDELPYWETSFYVKAILRNLLIYRMLDKGKVEVPNPIWASGASSETR